MNDEELHAHWDDCPLPPDANCEPCIEFARRFLKNGPLEGHVTSDPPIIRNLLHGGGQANG